MHNTLALITGASRGLGRALALQLAEKGAHIIALARTQGGLTDLDDAIRTTTGKSATLIPFDLAQDETAFANLGQTLFERFGRLDALILNAATLPALSPLSHIQEKDWRMVMAVNLDAPARLLRVLDPALRQAGNPVITFIGCNETGMGNAFWGAYNASKKALGQLATSYAEETKGLGYTVHHVTPGPMATKLRRSAFPGEDQTRLPTPETAAHLLLENWA